MKTPNEHQEQLGELKPIPPAPNPRKAPAK